MLDPNRAKLLQPLLNTNSLKMAGKSTEGYVNKTFFA